MKNVLLLSVGRRVELVEAFLKEINLKNNDIELFVTDIKPNYSAVCQKFKNYFTSIRSDDANYINFLLEKSKFYNIGMIIPTIDSELLTLSKNIELFKSNGIHIIVSNSDLIKICSDKRLTSDLFHNLKLDAPIIYKKDKIKFPCFAKPHSGSSSIGCYKIEREEDLAISMINDEKIILTEFVGEGFKEYTVDMYYDRHGSLKCLVPRERIEVRAGEISKGITRKNYVYDYVLSNFKNLHGARGCVTLQLFYNSLTHKIYFIEINPRFGGGFPLSYVAKANYPKWLLDEYFFENEIPFFDNWDKNLLMLRYDSKILIRNV